jgi:hypothetical protein
MAGTLPPGGSSMPKGTQVKKIQIGNPGSGGPGNTTTPATSNQTVPPTKLPATGK